EESILYDTEKENLRAAEQELHNYKIYLEYKMPRLTVWVWKKWLMQEEILLEEFYLPSDKNHRLPNGSSSVQCLRAYRGCLVLGHELATGVIPNQIVSLNPFHIRSAIYLQLI
ncbi:hypothetical protein NPIL_415131, partial [Nephila pilipes]